MSGRYRMRTAIRRKLPWVLLNMGFAGKPDKDCGDHEFYNHDGVVDHCYHCSVGVRPHRPEN